MKQTKIESAIERTADMITAFGISWCVYEYYIFGRTQELSSFNVVMIFTIISFVRGYLWRRFFNAELHKVVHASVSNFVNVIKRIK